MINRFSMCLLVGASLACAEHQAAERIQTAQTVLNEVMASSKDSIPRDLLAKAHCVVIVPSLKKGGFIVGAQYGVGVTLCRKPGGVGWTGPSTIKMEGGSLGLQIGAGETDVILVVMNKQGAEKLMRSEFTVGGEGAAMAGPVGRAASAETDAYMRAEILSYSRARGIFAGIAIKGSTLRSDDHANKTLYGKSVTHTDILRGNIAAPAVARGLIDSLTRYSLMEEKSTTGAVQ